VYIECSLLLSDQPARARIWERGVSFFSKLKIIFRCAVIPWFVHSLSCFALLYSAVNP
jgi:hypothetical protein